MNQIVIREIQERDNFEIATIVRDVLMEMGAPKVGTAYADPQLDFMFETYNQLRSVYFVVEARGLGLGIQIIEKCLQRAKDFGFESCYLETMPYMEAAQKLYKKVGFEYLCQPLGNTGHTSCPVWMLKKI